MTYFWAALNWLARIGKCRPECEHYVLADSGESAKLFRCPKCGDKYIL